MNDAPTDRGAAATLAVRLPLLFAGTAVAGVAGLSVHVFLQQTLRVPFPARYPAHAFIEQVDQATIVFGLLLFAAWSTPTLGRARTIVRFCVLFVVYAMIRESFRSAWMEGVVTTAYVYPLLAVVPRVVGYLVLTSACVVVAPRVPRLWQKAIAAAAVYAAFAFAVQPLIAAAFAAPLAHIAYLQHDEVYAMPYGMNVLVPAYVTYLEPAIGAVACAALVRRSLAPHPTTRLVRFVALMLLLRRSLLPPFIYAFSQPDAPLSAFASAGQFSLETIVLAVFAFAAWRFAAGAPPSRSTEAVTGNPRAT